MRAKTGNHIKINFVCLIQRTIFACLFLKTNISEINCSISVQVGSNCMAIYLKNFNSLAVIGNYCTSGNKRKTPKP